MQASLLVVEQGLLQIKTAEQRERQLALTARHQTLAAVRLQAAARGLLMRWRLQRVPPAIHMHLVCYIYKWEKGIYNTKAYHILLVISWALFMTH
jgi:hypothetical protein